jgi:hypothetical protein
LFSKAILGSKAQHKLEDLLSKLTGLDLEVLDIM